MTHKTWTDIADTVLEPGDPVRSVDMLSLRDNPIAMAEGAAGAPKLPRQFIDTGTEAAVAALEIIGLLADYRSYEFEFDDALPAIATQALILRTSDDNGATFESGAADYGHIRSVSIAGDTNPGVAAANGDTLIQLTSSQSNSANEVAAGRIVVHNPMNLGSRTIVRASISFSSAGDEAHAISSGRRNANEANDAIQIAYVSGNIASIEWTLNAMRAGATA